MDTRDRRIEKAKVEAYDLPLARMWQSRRATLTRRKGWLLHLEDKSGCIGIGECAPLPGMGTESLERAGAALADAVKRITGYEPRQLLHQLPAADDCVAARCALETALLDLEARRTVQPLRSLLDVDALDSVEVNASLGVADQGLRLRVVAALEDGFRTLKIKIGVSDWCDELTNLEAAAMAGDGSARLRLDVNGAWSDVDAPRNLADLSGLPIDCVEEPVSGMNHELLSELQMTLPFALAADESLPRLVPLLEAGRYPLRRLILKPTVLGGPLAAMRIARLAASNNVEVVVTTTIEAAPGRALAAHLAAATRSKLAHGLDTADWLATDVGSGLKVEQGRLLLDDAIPGLGVNLRS
jgi:o-succinylbenzoate synthase